MLMATVAQATIDIATDFGSGADTFIGNDSKTSYTKNRGANTELETRYNGGGSRFTCSYYRFDLTGTSADFAGATLMLEASYIKSSTGRRLDVYGLVDETLDQWDETTITYENAPGMLQPASGWNMGDYLIDELKLVHLGFLTTPGTGGATPVYPIRFSSNTTDLGSAFSNFLTADTNKLVTIVLINSTGTSGTNSEDKIASKEHATLSLIHI